MTMKISSITVYGTLHSMAILSHFRPLPLELVRKCPDSGGLYDIKVLLVLILVRRILDSV